MNATRSVGNRSKVPLAINDSIAICCSMGWQQA